MSLRYTSRVLFQAGMRLLQGFKDQASKCDATIKTLGDSAASNISSSKQARRFSVVKDSGAFTAPNNDKLKQAEESLRTVMYLSCWGPN